MSLKQLKMQVFLSYKNYPIRIGSVLLFAKINLADQLTNNPE